VWLTGVWVRGGTVSSEVAACLSAALHQDTLPPERRQEGKGIVSIDTQKEIL